MIATAHGSKRTLFVIMVAIVLGALVVSARHGIFDLARLTAQRDSLRTEIEALKSRNQELLAEIERLKRDPATVEELARREMGLAKEGEIVYRFSPSSPDSEENRSDGRSGAGP